MKALDEILAADVSVRADGGGKRPAVTEPVLGFYPVMTMHEQLAVLFRTHQSALVRIGFTNGLPCCVALDPVANFRRPRST